LNLEDDKRQTSGSAKKQPEVKYANAPFKAGLRGRKVSSLTEQSGRSRQGNGYEERR